MPTPTMELRLEEFIDSLHILAGIDDLNDETPIVMRLRSQANNETITVVCATVEPTRMVLPANVVWINFNRSSEFYKQALKRTSKESNVETPEFNQSWRLLYFYEDVFESQYYDPEDLGNLGDPVGPATVPELGMVRLNLAPASAMSPRVISEGHKSLINNRDPLPHLEQHPEKPATILDVEGTVVSIIDQPNPLKDMMLLLNSDGTAQWRKLTEADIDMEA